MGANEKQIGGSHYQKVTGVCSHCGGEVQHWDLMARMPYLEGVITKYVLRWQLKGGVEDLKKAQHYLEKLIEVVSPKKGTRANTDVGP